MILIVSPNPTLDRIYQVARLHVGAVHRPDDVCVGAGGKGVNVARIYAGLGGKAVTTGFLGGATGAIVSRLLSRERLEFSAVRVRESTRTCVTILDRRRGTQTEVNEPGPAVSARAVRRLKDRVAALLRNGDVGLLVLSGSLPPGAPCTLYRDLIEVGRSLGTPCALDSSGAALREGVAARPWLLKPNRAELESLAGHALPDRKSMLIAARALHGCGIDVVTVTNGADGAGLLTHDGAWWAEPPRIDLVTALGAGDAFLAGLLWAYGFYGAADQPSTALRLAVAAGALHSARRATGAGGRENILAAVPSTPVGPWVES